MKGKKMSAGELMGLIKEYNPTAEIEVTYVTTEDVEFYRVKSNVGLYLSNKTINGCSVAFWTKKDIYYTNIFINKKYN